MKEIAICLIIHNDYYATRYCIENLMSKTNHKFRFQIVDNASTDENVIEYIKTLAEKEKGHLHRFSEQKSLTECYNYLLQTVYQEYCIIFPLNCIVGFNWLEDLITSAEKIENFGCVCIRPIGMEIQFLPVLHTSILEPEDYLENVIETRDAINTVVLFKKELTSIVGNFDVHLQSPGFELSEFCFRIKVNGFQNYYIRKQMLYKMRINNEVLFPKMNKDNIAQFKEAIEIMFKVKTFRK